MNTKEKFSFLFLHVNLDAVLSVLCKSNEIEVRRISSFNCSRETLPKFRNEILHERPQTFVERPRNLAGAKIRPCEISLIRFMMQTDWFWFSLKPALLWIATLLARYVGSLRLPGWFITVLFAPNFIRSLHELITICLAFYSLTNS